MKPLQNLHRLRQKGISLLVLLALLASSITQASSLNLAGGPNLAIPANIMATPGGVVSVAINYTGGDNAISALVFSIDYDQILLSFNPADANKDGIPDAVHFTVPTTFSPSVTYDAADTDGELDFIISDFAPPLATLPDGTLATIDFTAGTPETQQTAAVTFSASPAPSFGSADGKSVPGTWQDGSVLIPGKTNSYRLNLPLAQNPIIVPTLTPTPTNTPTKTPKPPVDPTFTSTPTRTKTPPLPCLDLIANGGFESSTAWVMPITEYTAGYATDRFHSGARSARVGIVNPVDNRYSYSSVSQKISIPWDAKSVTLSYWLYAITTESASLPLSAPPTGIFPQSADPLYDAQYVLVYDTSGTLLETLLWQRYNTQAWKSFSHNLLKYAGQSVKLYFGVYNDGWGGATGMYVDDVALTVCK